MVAIFPWQGALVFMGLTGLPHPDSLYRATAQLMSKLQINLPAYGQYGSADPYGQHVGDTSNADADQAVQDAAQAVLIIVCTLVAIFILQIVAICMYKSKVHDQKPPLGDNLKTMETGQFHYGLFGCFSNINECMCSFCCTTVRFADTHSATSGGGFWGSFCAFVGLNAIIGALCGAIVNALMPPPNPFDAHAVAAYQGEHVNILLQECFRGLAFGVYLRGKLRKKLGDPDPSKGALHDFFAWGWCSCCALTQESVEADIAADVTIECPFTLKKGRVRAREVAPSDQENLLGEALLVEGR